MIKHVLQAPRDSHWGKNHAAPCSLYEDYVYEWGLGSGQDRQSYFTSPVFISLAVTMTGKTPALSDTAQAIKMALFYSIVVGPFSGYNDVISKLNLHC